MIGQAISHYRILEKLGQGGMGVVYKAQDTKLDRLVALKFLPSHLNASNEEEARFIQEAKAASALNHPNVCTIYDIKEFEGQTFIVMEYLEGKTLREAKQGMDAWEAVDVVAQIAEGLAAAHEKGIVHRDIKADNIMVRPNGRAQILDFGLAKLPGRSLLTKAGSTIGTTAYMSPEQAQGAEANHRTDIFSLGVLLYEVLTGQLPFKGTHEAAVMYEVINVDPPLPSGLTPEVEPGLDRIVMRCLEKDQNKRYQSARDVAADLRGFKRNTEGIGTHPPAKTPRQLKSKTIPWLKVGLLAGAFLVAGVVVFFALRGNGETLDSLAVLPFENTSGDQNMEYLSDGITESLINSLSQLPQLKVMSRSSVFRFKADTAGPRTVGQKLGVRAVLFGRVQQRSDDLVISAELIDVADDSHLWGEQYNRKAADIIAVQEEITREISQKLRLRLGENDAERRANKQTTSTVAYQSYLKGRYHWNKRMADDLRKAIDYFNDAAQADPGYALAYAGLADTYNILGVLGEQPPAEAFPRAKAAAGKALDIDPSLAEVYATLGDISIHFDWDLKTAGRHLKKAIELDPQYAVAHHWYSEYLTIEGRHDEAIAETKKAVELDPLSLMITTFVGWNYYYAGQYDSAVAAFGKALEIEKGFPWAHLWLGGTYLQMHKENEAFVHLVRASEMNDNPVMLASLGRAYALSGRTSDAQDILDTLTTLSKRRFVSAYNFALVYYGMDDREKTFEWLEKAFQERSSWLYFIKVDPIWDPLRDDPRLNALFKRMDLEK